MGERNVTTPYPDLTGTEPCRTGNPDRFHPKKGSNGAKVAAVKAECAPCPVKDACLAFALTNRVLGIWASTTVEEREAIRKRDGIRAQPLSFSARVLVGHGSWAGVTQHRKRFEPNCAACRDFATDESRAYRQRKSWTA
jgi:hypothetical protein